MTAFSTHLTYEFKTILRDKSMLLLTYLFPLFFFIMMGLLMTKVNPGFAQTMTPAMILVAVMSGTLLGMPNPLMSAREAGIFRSYKINGVPSISIITMPVITSILHMAIISIIIVFAGKAFFNAPLPTNWIFFFLVWIISLVAFSGLGMLIGVISPNSRSTTLIAQLVFLPSMILGGLMMPASAIPATLAPFSKLLPTSHAMSAFTQLAYGNGNISAGLVDCALLLLGGLVAFGLSVYLFKWDNNQKSTRSIWLGLAAILPYALSILF